MPDNQMKNNEHKEDQLLYEKYLKTTSKQAGMVFGTRIIGYLLGFVMQAMFARFLGPDKYGVYSLGLTAANVGVLFGSFGLPAGMTRFLGEYIGNKKYNEARSTIVSGFKWSLFFSFIGAIVIFFFKEPIAIGIFNEKRLIPLLPWFSIILILLALTNLLNGIVKGFKKPSVFTFYKEIVERIIRIGIFLILFFLGKELLGVVIATFTSSFVVVLCLLFWIFRKQKTIFEHKSKTPNNSRKLLSYSSNMLFVAFTSFLMGQVNRLIIGGFLESKQVGLYAISDTIAHLSVFFLAAFNSIFAAIISEVFHKGKINLLSDLYSNVTRWITTLTLPLTLWIVVFSEDILFIFGSEYSLAKWTLIVLAIGQFVNAMTGACGLLLSMTKYQRFVMLNGVLIASVNIGMNLLLIPKFGILGSALAGGIAISSVNSIKLVEVLILLRIQPYNKRFLKLLIPTSVTLIVLISLNYFFENIFVTISGLFISFSLFILVFITSKLVPEDKMILNAVIKNLIGKNNKK